MKLVFWNEWLEQYIPYYESKKHEERFVDNPPQVVLIVYPYDELRNRQLDNKTARRWEEWDTVTEKIELYSKNKAIPLFLERDTRQQWYWAFWDRNDALIVMLKV
jgi:hypothetical protein